MSTIVGSLAIDRTVDPNGSLFLKVPIQVPPAKHAPDLSISYHSAVHQQSVLGHGWDLHAFGLIQRTARTVAQDGVSGMSHLSDTKSTSELREIKYRICQL